MSLHKHEPVPESEMVWLSPKYTLCQVIREIFWLADKHGDTTIKYKSRIAMAMAKAMNNKLVDYAGHEVVDSMFEEDEKQKQIVNQIRDLLRTASHVS